MTASSPQTPSASAPSPGELLRPASVRVISRVYMAAAGGLTLTSLVVFNSGSDRVALFLLLAGWVLTPFIALFERVAFDGERLRREGALAVLSRLRKGGSTSMTLGEIEWVETEAVRTLRRGGRVRYRYRTEITGGRGRSFAFVSGGAGYRRFVSLLLPRIAPEKLDARSAELRDYLRDERSLRATRDLLHIAPPGILEDLPLDEPAVKRRAFKHARQSSMVRHDDGRWRHLRAAANELRVAGRLRESGEAFRRALHLMPGDGWLIYDFARYLFSQASASGDAHLMARSNAALRLAARRAAQDGVLLARIGESLAERGDLQYAAKVYHRALEIDPGSFRASIGLAEIALRTAKLAHVIHHYRAAARTAPDAALAHFAEREADYYFRLNADDDYLAAELRRIGWLNHTQTSGRNAARLTFLALAFAILMESFQHPLAVAGWALVVSAAAFWLAFTVASRFLAGRTKVRPVD